MEERDHLKMSSEDLWSWAQTMNYVGQLAGQVFVTVKELYKGLNPATLSGCIDVIVVCQPDGTLQCSPFHVRFGKMGVLRSKEKVVDIEINGESVDLHMKLGDNGEAFFVEETEDDQETIPYHLATSPILTEGSSLMELQLKKNSVDRIRNMDTGGPSQLPSSAPSAIESTSVKKRRKRRRRSTHKIDTSKRDENADTTEDENMFPIEISSDEENELLETARTSVTDLCRDKALEANSSSINVLPHPYSDGEWSPPQSKPRTCAGKSSPLTVPADGGLSSSCPHQSSHYPATDSPSGSRPPTPKSDSELVSKSLERSVQKSNTQMHWDWGELPQATKSASSLKLKESSSTMLTVSPSESTHFRVIQSNDSEEFRSLSSLPVLGQDNSVTTLEDTEIQEAAPVMNELDIDTLGAAAPPLPANEEVKQGTTSLTQQASKTDSPSKKKDKRCRHLGADGVYLDDLTGMEPEVAALYFPKNGEQSAHLKNANENGPRSANQSPQSVGSSGIDSGVESTSDGIRDLPSIAISLCGGLSDNKEISKEMFLEQEISYQQFVDNPAIIDDPNLVVKIGSKYYNWTTAAPLLLAMQAFQKPLPKATVDSIMSDKMPKKGGRWWFSWRGRNSSIKEEIKPVEGLSGKNESDNPDRNKDDSSSSDEDRRASNQAFGSLPANSNHLPLLSGVGYKKTLRLSSEQLKSLNLKNGPNDVIFSVTTQYQGTCRCEGTIYLWNWDDKVVISDIDGTITRSDTLGHILPTLGKDWTHQGIAKLYHKVSQNGYKFLYCSARAIGMADMTRGYLHWVNERGTVLPQGPLLLSPSSLFSAFHREVIEKKPEKFKVQCLTDIKNLFHPCKEPFYAAFGNRPADVYSYKQVGVSLNRIFTVNPKGELIQEHAKTNISSYVRLCEVVDHVFPLLKRSHSSDFPCSDTYSQFTYWREPLPPFENQDIQSDVP
ncbi:phosphatidate phosphatase LPIN1 isoform X3 [Elgaria multicarinata webbii]|uniref:phosphatidate phosphatase LPIN1 isoform X3 n=1 Tax=Elgaria multicarinata webbii TaxID=159646 RepID=UPI002FCD0800